MTKAKKNFEEEKINLDVEKIVDNLENNIAKINKMFSDNKELALSALLELIESINDIPRQIEQLAKINLSKSFITQTNEGFHFDSQAFNHAYSYLFFEESEEIAHENE